MAILSDRDKFRFIELVKNYPCIWDCTDPQYVNRGLASECYLSIAKAMGNGMTEYDARRVLKSLRTQLRVNVKNLEERRSSGVPVWKFYKPLEFLVPYCTGTKRRNTGSKSGSVERPVQNHNNNRTRIDTDHLDPEEIMSKSSNEDSFHDDSDVSMSLSLSVDEDYTDGVEDEDVYDSVHSQRPVPQVKNEISKQNQSRSHHIQDSRIRSSEDASVMGSDANVQRRLYKSKRRRRSGSKVSAAHVLFGLTNKLLRREPESGAMTENDHFFRMMAIEVSRLPASAQDSMRYKIHGLLVEEKKKLVE